MGRGDDLRHAVLVAATGTAAVTITGHVWVLACIAAGTISAEITFNVLTWIGGRDAAR